MGETAKPPPGVPEFVRISAVRAQKHRKACKRETTRTLERLKLPERSREPVIDSAETARLFLAGRCFSCLRCPGMVTRMARWHAGMAED